MPPGYEAQTEALGQTATALVAVANAVADGHITVVPEVLVTGGGGGALDGLAATLMRTLGTGDGRGARRRGEAGRPSGDRSRSTVEVLEPGRGRSRTPRLPSEPAYTARMRASDAGSLLGQRSTSFQGTPLSTRGSPGRPSTRSPMMFFITSSEPPAMCAAGAPRRAWCQR